ncbi:MAG: DUF502 domain-containing protein [Phycisphaeraceae bacterium]|nr:DUF502 domain-containing protein [Phycisphaeraceae bacterium]
MMTRVLSIFIRGLVVVLPLAITALVLIWLGTGAERLLSTAVRWALPDAWYVPGMGVAAGIALVFVVGILVNVWGVPQIIAAGERIIARIPLVKTIYGAVRDLLGFFGRTGPAGGAVSKVVMVSIGDTGLRSVGVLTRERFEGLPEGLGGEGKVAVFVPFSYQIGGLTTIVSRDKVTPLNMSLEDAMRFVVTAGADGGARGAGEQS